MQKAFFPRPVEGFQMESLDGEIVLLHPACNIIIYSNQTGAIIWQLCNGQRSVEEIVEILGAAYPGSRAEIAVDAPKTIQMLVSHGALTTK
jgi:hypothetical protein